MLVRDVRYHEREGSVVLAASVERRTGERFDPEFQFEGVGSKSIAARGDPFFAALLPLAMATGERLEIDAPVSPRLLGRAGTIMDIYRAWAGAMPVDVRASAREPPPGKPAVGLFFTCGLDSFYTLQKRVEGAGAPEDRIARLITVQGFDVKPSDRDLFQPLMASVGRVAAAIGAGTISVRTNIRSFSEPLMSWDLYHGAALASVGLALAGALRRCIIASSFAYQHLRPWGSHPLLDPLWSTEQLELVHDGCERRRFEKVEAIAGWPLAMDTLRVCYSQRPGEYNCGRCPKCLTTMLALERVGALERCATLPSRLDLRAVRKMDLTGDGPYVASLNVRRALEASGERKDIVAALRHAHRRQRLRAEVRRYRLLRLALRVRAALRRRLAAAAP
jgi:hypothetical protein